MVPRSVPVPIGRLLVAGLIATGGPLLIQQRVRPHAPRSEPRLISAAQATGPIDATGRARSSDANTRRYRFRDHLGAKVEVEVQIPEESVRRARSEFGYRPSELAQFQAELHRAHQDAVAAARAACRETPARCDAHRRALAQTQRTLTAKAEAARAAFLQSRGFRIWPSPGLLSADIPALVERNAPRLRPVAERFARLAERRAYGRPDLLGALTVFAQSALQYRLPPPLRNGRVTGGIITPPEVLAEGWGDCDSKSAMLASLFVAWPSLAPVGISIPGHYLLAVRKIPGPRDAFIRFQGVPYVLVYPAGPARMRPGRVAPRTMAAIRLGTGVHVEALGRRAPRRTSPQTQGDA